MLSKLKFSLLSFSTFKFSFVMYFMCNFKSSFFILCIIFNYNFLIQLWVFKFLCNIHHYHLFYFIEMVVVMETIRPFVVTAMVLDIWLAIVRKVTNKAVTTVVNKGIWVVNAVNATSSRASIPNLIIILFKFAAR